MHEDLRLIFSTLGAVATLVLIPVSRWLWKAAIALKETSLILKGHDGRSGVLAWQSAVDERMNYVGQTLVQVTRDLSNNDREIERLRTRYHDQFVGAVNQQSLAIMKLADALEPDK